MLCLHKFEILDDQPINVKFEDSEYCELLMDEVSRVRAKNVFENKQYEDFSRTESSGQLFRT